MVECTESAVLEGLDYEVDEVISLECDDGWAVISFATTDSAASYDENEVLEAEGQFWILKDRADVCGTVSLDDPTTRPDDAQIPESLWFSAAALPTSRAATRPSTHREQELVPRPGCDRTRLADCQRWRRIFDDGLHVIQKQHRDKAINPVSVQGWERQRVAKLEAERLNADAGKNGPPISLMK